MFILIGVNMVNVPDNYYLEEKFRYSDNISLTTDILVNEPIEIGKNNITIDGNGHTIDGNGKQRLFKITGKNVVLTNLIFKNAKAPTKRFSSRDGYGGAIFNNGQLELINCEFINNVAKRNGYDILNTGDLRIENCKFSQNRNDMDAIHNVGLIKAFDSEKSELEPFISDDGVHWISKESILPQPTLNDFKIPITSESTPEEVADELSNASKPLGNDDEGYLFEQPFDAYEGDEPFAFISYKHADYKKVYPIMDKFHNEGIKMWYDAGLPVSRNYDIEIAKHIIKSKLFVTFITEKVIECSEDENDYLVKELSVALHLGKECLPIFLDDVDLAGFYLMHYLNKQSILKPEYKNNEEMFIEACINAFKKLGINPNE